MLKRLKDDEFVDEITIVVTERYKTSGLSGNEWRFGALTTLSRKGQVVARASTHSVADAVALLPWLTKVWGETSQYTTDMDVAPFDAEADSLLCCQPGCREFAVTFVKLVREFSGDGAGMSQLPSTELRRCFCKRHTRRGDQALEDNDKNYVAIEVDKVPPTAPTVATPVAETKKR